MGDTPKNGTSAALFNLAQTALQNTTVPSTSMSSSLPRSASQGAPGGMTRNGSMASARGSVAPREYEWRRFLTVEERQGVRSKIRAAYKASCSTYEDLLATATAIEEELLHISAPSRLDYFKSGCQFGTRVSEKRKQIATDEPAALRGTKRAKPEEGRSSGCHVSVSQDGDSQEYELTQES